MAFSFLSTFQKCLECKQVYLPPDEAVAICDWCLHIHPYHMITDHIAVGGHRSPYDQFDIIIDMNCPENGVEQGGMDVEKMGEKYVLRLGVVDCAQENYRWVMEAYLDTIITSLTKLVERVKRKKKKEKVKILFHCFAGISRSVTACIAYMTKILPEMTAEKAWSLVKSIRHQSNPNPMFRAILGI